MISRFGAHREPMGLAVCATDLRIPGHALATTPPARWRYHKVRGRKTATATIDTSASQNHAQRLQLPQCLVLRALARVRILWHSMTAPALPDLLHRAGPTVRARRERERSRSLHPAPRGVMLLGFLVDVTLGLQCCGWLWPRHWLSMRTPTNMLSNHPDCAALSLSDLGGKGFDIPQDATWRLLQV